jgi:hypothetical protein
MDLAAPHRYVREFYVGVVDKMSRMFIRWIIMSHGVFKVIDDHLAGPETACEYCFFNYHKNSDDGYTLEDTFGNDAKENGGMIELTSILDVDLSTLAEVDRFKKSGDWRTLIDEVK